METNGIVIEGLNDEDPARLLLLKRMTSALFAQAGKKGPVEKLEILKNENKLKMRLLLGSINYESEGEDKNLFFAFGKAQKELLKKLEH